MSIRSRLLLLVLALLLPGLAAAAWLIGQTWHDERATLQRSLRETTRALSMVVERELRQRAAVARALAASPVLDDAPTVTPQQRQDFERQASRAMQGLQGWVELTAAEGLLLSTAPGAAPEAAPAASGTAAPLAEQAMVRPLTTYATGGVQHAAVVEPVLREGRPVLNVAVTILPQEMQHIIDELRMPADWTMAVLDNTGTVVARRPGGAGYAGRAPTPDLRQLLAGQRESEFTSVTLDGVPVAGAFHTSLQGWTFVTALPRGQFADLPAAVLQMAAGTLVLLGVAVAGALWVAGRIATPVDALKRSATRLQTGLAVGREKTGVTEFDAVAAALAEASDSMRHARRELEREVGDAVARTRAAEQEVAQSQRVAALGRLTGGVAHDFNNLLGVISNSANLIQLQSRSPDTEVPVAATLRAVEAGSRLTQHLLRFAGRQPHHPQVLDLTRTLPDLDELLQTVLGRRVRLHIAVAPDTLRTEIDAGELELALIHLALNARDAMPDGGALRVTARNAEAAEAAHLPPAAYVAIVVADDGPGIEADLESNVFEPFFTTKSVGQGTGLGLSQVHGFCVQAGGGALLRSRPGQGTTVTLLLPAFAGVPARAHPPTDASPGEADSLDGVRVLLVEDNAELADVTTSLLATYGCDVLQAGNADEAMRLLEPGPLVDIVLSDVVMPGTMDGVAMARALRLRWPALPVVLISAYSSALAGAHDFTVLHKPCPPADLMAALRHALAGGVGA